MRRMTLIAAISLISLPVFAQSGVNTLYPPPVKTDSVIIMPTVVEGPNAGQNTTDAVDSAAKQAIGYDPKVKRDANGKVIADEKTSAAPVKPKLRNDSHLRSDSHPRR